MIYIRPLILTLLMGCSSGAGVGFGESISIDASIVDNPLSVLSAIVTVETDLPCEVSVQFDGGSAETKTTPPSPLGTSHEIVVVGMRPDSDYRLVPIASNEGQEVGRGTTLTFSTGSVPMDVPDFEVVVHDRELVQPGITVFGPSKTIPDGMDTYLVGVDEAGYVVWYYTATAEDAFTNDRMVRPLPNGNLLTMGQDFLREIHVSGVTRHEIRADQTDFEIFHHDVIQTPDETLVSLTHETREIDVPAAGGIVRVLGDIVVEFGSEGEVVWEWSTFDHLDTTRFPTDLSQMTNHDDAYDWTHANAVEYIETDDSLLLSLRSQHWVLKIDRATGNILWRLGPEGDFELEGEGEWFYGQHTPRPGENGELLLYDNGNDRPDSELHSRAAAFHLDETNAKAVQYWEDRTNHFTEALGSVQRLPNGNTLVCAGGAFEEGSPAQIVEVTPDSPSVEVWELNIHGHVIYRATRLETLYFAEED